APRFSGATRESFLPDRNSPCGDLTRTLHGAFTRCAREGAWDAACGIARRRGRLRQGWRPGNAEKSREARLARWVLFSRPAAEAGVDRPSLGADDEEANSESEKRLEEARAPT